MPEVDRCDSDFKKANVKAARGPNSALRFGPHLLMQNAERQITEKAERLSQAIKVLLATFSDRWEIH